MSLPVPTSEDPTVTVVCDEALARRAPLVSVCVVTYNQQDYIGEALDSVLAQKTDFAYELIVGDDCSTDATRALLERYQRAHPERIRLHLHEEHYEGIPARKNMVTNLESARGRYVALLDGDDYWISRDKLQRQAAFLEAHPEVVLSFHDARMIYEKGTEFSIGERTTEAPDGCERPKSRMVDLDELIPPGKRTVPAASMTFRRCVFEPVPSWFWEVLSADWAMQLYLAQRGDVYYHHDLLAAWRKHPRSLTSNPYGTLETLLLEEIPVFAQMCPPFRQVAAGQRAAIYGGIAGARRQEMYGHLAAGQYGRALRKLWRGGAALLHHLFYRYGVSSQHASESKV